MKKKGRRKKPYYSKLIRKKGQPTIRIHKESSIEKIIRLSLAKLSIPYIQEFKLKNKYFDFLIFDYIDHDIQKPICFIEVNGGYFHAYEYIVEKTKQFSKLTKVQKRNIYNDKRKKKLAEDHKIPVLYLWEKDIHADINKIERSVISFLEEIYGSVPTMNKLNLDSETMTEREVIL